MSINNQMHNLYKEMKQGYADNNDSVVEQCAAGWMQLAKENPFVYDTPEYEEFFQMKKSYDIWAKGAVDRKINRRRMAQHAKALCDLNVKNPYVYDKQAELAEKKAKEEWIAKEQQRKEEELKRADELKRAKENDDVSYVMLEMTEAYNKKDEVTFKQFAIHLAEIAEENPFNVETEEYNKLEEMKEAFKKNNMRRVVVVAGQLCEIINYTEIEPQKVEKVVLEEPKKVLGVPEEEKKSWLRFLHPWRKEGEKNDSP